MKRAPLACLSLWTGLGLAGCSEEHRPRGEAEHEDAAVLVDVRDGSSASSGRADSAAEQPSPPTHAEAQDGALDASALRDAAESSADASEPRDAAESDADASSEQRPADAGPACNALPTPTQSVPLQHALDTAPMLNGGSILDGVYRLEQMVIYAATRATSIEARAETLEVRGRSWQRAAYYDNTETMRSTQQSQLRESSFSLDHRCGDPQSSRLLVAIPAGNSGFYAATPALLSLSVPAAVPDGGRALLTYRRIANDDAACKYDCESDVSYTTMGLGTGLFRYVIDKVDRARDRCTRIMLVAAAAPAQFAISVPPSMIVERAWFSARAADCESVSIPPPAGAVLAESGEGVIRSSKTGADCALDVDVTLRFAANAEARPEQQRLATQALLARGLCLP